MKKVRAFTLVELLVVVAITGVILSLLIIPIVQSFNFTRSAQGFADGQERARRLIEQVVNEIANSPGVRDNAGFRGQVCIVVPDNNGTNISLLADYAKLDVLVPLQGDPSDRGPSGAFNNPNTGGEDPTLEHSVGQVVFPVAPGATIVRYFISLKKPLALNNLDPGAYYNPYIDYKRSGGARWQALPGQEDNLYVIRRAEVSPKVFNPGTGLFEVNTAFFDDADGDGEPDMDDPYFMTQDAPGQPPLAGPARQAKANRIRAWVRSSQVVTEFYRYDAIQPLINKQNRQLLTVGTIPRISTLVQFRPASVSNEPATGSSLLRLGEERDNSGAGVSDILFTKKASWSSTVVRNYPLGYDPADPNNNEYFVARFDPRAGLASHRIYKYDPDLDTDGDDKNGEGNIADDIEVFDILAYENHIRLGFVYPFRRGMEASNARSGWMGIPAIRAKFNPFVPNTSQGKLTTSFPIEFMGEDNPTGAVLPRADKNLPSLLTGLDSTPTTDPSPAGNFYDPIYDAINLKFNKVWFDHPELRAPGQTHRFMDLRVVTSADGTLSPLDPDPTLGFTQGRIVPGSEIIVGPDQNPGPSYGQPVKYTRVTSNPGPNQYKINYVDQVEPNYALLGYPAPPAVYDPQNFVSAVIQPRYKAGYIQFNSNPNLALPANQPIFVSYRFQFNQPGDSFAVDYDTRSQIDVLLTIRNYPQSSLPTPAMITVKGSAPIRNLSR